MQVNHMKKKRFLKMCFNYIEEFMTIFNIQKFYINYIFII